MVFLFLLLILIIFITSKIVIDIGKIEIKSIKDVSNVESFSNFKNNKFYNDYDIKIKLQILQILPILWIKIDKNKIKKLSNSKRFNDLRLRNIKFKDVKKCINFKNIKSIKEKIIINIKYFNLNISIGTESIILTSFLIPILSSIISILLTSSTAKTSNQKFLIQPIYNNRKLYNF